LDDADLRHGSLREFHALAAPRSRKLDQIRKNPKVAWVFNSPGFEDVITIHGTAPSIDDPMLRSRSGRACPEAAGVILLSDENLEFVIIRTGGGIEHLKPRRGQTTPTVVSALTLVVPARTLVQPGRSFSP